MEARIVTLSENTAGLTRGILGEHGFSVYVEMIGGGTRLIFDTGQTTTVVHNADALGIDLGGLPVALSHGHYDHTGGLRSVLGKTGPTVVYCHPDAFMPRYSCRGEETRYIGIPFDKVKLEEMGARFDLSRKGRKIAPNVWLTGEVPRVTDFERPSRDLVVKTEGGLEVDPLKDDQSLVLVLEKGLFVILGCAHSGMINTLEQARNITGIDRIFGVVGGTHLGFGGEERLARTIEALKEYDLEILGTSHCTGPKAASVLAAEFGERFIFNNAGTVIEL